jgi:hypothetical protein
LLKQLYTSLYTRLSNPTEDYSWRYIDPLNEITLSEQEIRDRNEYFNHLSMSADYDQLNFCIWYKENRMYLMIYPLQSNRKDFVNRSISNALYFIFVTDLAENFSVEDSKFFYKLIRTLSLKSDEVYQKLVTYGENLLLKKDMHQPIPKLIDLFKVVNNQPIKNEYHQDIDFKHTSLVSVNLIDQELFTILQQMRTEVLDEYTSAYGLFFSSKINVQQIHQLCKIDFYMTKWRVYSENIEIQDQNQKRKQILIKDPDLLIKQMKNNVKDLVHQMKDKFFK